MRRVTTPRLSRRSSRKALHTAGFSVVEAMLAVAVFGLVVTSLTGAFIYGRESQYLSGQRNRATFLAEEGQEALRSIRDKDFTLFGPADGSKDGTYGLVVDPNTHLWTLSGSSDTTDIYTRTVKLSTVSETAKHFVVKVTWRQNAQRDGVITMGSNLTSWRPRSQAHGKIGGLLVYGDGGSGSGNISYRILADDVSNGGPCSPIACGTWNSAALVPDSGNARGNKPLRAVRAYSSPGTRKEEVILSEHYSANNPKTESMFAQVYSQNSQGAWSWGTPQPLVSWATSSFVNLESFSGTYLADGRFMAVYADGSGSGNVPKYRIWNGTSWTAQANLPATLSLPTAIVAKARPTTNEVMAAFLNTDKSIQTEYFNGTSWTLQPTHAITGVADANNEQLVDFTWSPNDNTKGGLVFASPANLGALALKVWSANGSGGGSWSAIASQPVSNKNISSVAITASVDQDTYIVCAKDKSATLTCFDGDSTPSIHVALPRSNWATENGLQRSFHAGFQSLLGAQAIVVNSDGTNTGFVNSYTIDNVWNKGSSGSNTKIQNLGTVSGNNSPSLKTVRLIPDDQSEDIMILLGVDNSEKGQQTPTIEFDSVVWGGSNNDTAGALYNSATGKALQHQACSSGCQAPGTNKDPTDYWYDFVWDSISR